MVHKHVLIVTYGRSGSTLLQGLLNTIDGWLVRGENNNFAYALFHAYQLLEKAKNRQPPTSVEPTSVNVTSPWYGCHEVDLIAYRKRVRQIIDEVLFGEIDRTDIVCCGFKEIRYFPVLKEDSSGRQLRLFLDFLLQCLAPCKIIFLTRDHAQVARSDWFREMDRPKLLEDLRAFDTLTAQYGEQHSDQCFRLDYSDLTGPPDRLGKLFKFLEVGMDEDRIRETVAQPHGYPTSGGSGK